MPRPGYRTGWNSYPTRGVLYSLASTAYSGDYRDITSGSNGAYKAYYLYDFVTGLGSPVANDIISQLETQP